ncbi:MAG: hypothetical protein VX755_11910, partial [Pseudomonadota bacterium]|nr:hypothetical protein [Pseudomonadota bacterium]
ISAAVAASISLTVWDVAHIPTTYGGAVNHRLKMIGLCQGDLTTIKPAEAAQFLIISCLPGDYTPSAGSLIGAIQTAWGINVGQMAANPAADYRSDLHCWISQPFSSLQPSKTVPYTQLICLESTGANAVAWIPGVFSAIQRYVPSPPPIPETGATIASALLSTGGAGADPVQVLTALFNGCQTLMTAGPGYNLTCLRIDVFNPALQGPLVAAFDQLKPAAPAAMGA